MKELKRILSLFLCLAMLVGYLPVGALAAEGETATEPSVVDVVVETTVPETTVPETTVPETTVPETTVPETTVPETTVPETTVPETTVPETTVPETTEETVPETTPVRKPVKKGPTKVQKEATGEAAPRDDAKDYLFFGADCGDASGVAAMINNMEAKIGENQLDYLALIGAASAEKDAVLAAIAGATTSLTADNVSLTAAVIEEQEGGAEFFAGAKFYVYGAPLAEEAEVQKFLDWANGSEIDKAKTVIVLPDAPLHESANAAAWIQALNTVAAGEDAAIDRNVIVFWAGAAETEEEEKLDTYVVPGGSIAVAEVLTALGYCSKPAVLTARRHEISFLTELSGNIYWFFVWKTLLLHLRTGLDRSIL